MAAKRNARIELKTSIKPQKHRQDMAVLQIFHEFKERIGHEENQTVRKGTVNPVWPHDQFLVVVKQRKLRKKRGTLAQ